MLRYLDAMTVSVIAGGMVVVILCLVLRRLEATQKAVPMWLASGLVGALFGTGVSLASMHGLGYHWNKEAVTNPAAGNPMASMTGANPANGPMAGGGGMGGGMPGGMGGGMPGGGMGGGMPGGMGGGMAGGGANAPRSRRDLTTLVGKLEVLSRGLTLKLDDGQTAKIAVTLTALDQDDEMTEDAAKEHLDALEAILTEENKTTLGAIDLPRRAPAGRGGAGGPGGGPGGPGGGGPGGMGGGAGGAGGAPSTENPFKQEEQAKRLKSLRDRMGSSVASGNSKE